MDQVYVVRHKVLVEGLSARKVARELGISRNTVQRYVEGPEPGAKVVQGALSPRRRGPGGEAEQVALTAGVQAARRS